AASCWSSVTAGSTTRVRSSTSSPRAVTRTPCRPRSNSAPPSARSIRLSCALNAGCASPSSVAARVRLPASAIALIVFRCRNSSSMRGACDVAGPGARGWYVPESGKGCRPVGSAGPAPGAAGSGGPVAGRREQQPELAHPAGLQLGQGCGHGVEEDHAAVVVVPIDEVAGDLLAAEFAPDPDQAPGVRPGSAERADDVVPVVGRGLPEPREVTPDEPPPPARGLVAGSPRQRTGLGSVDPVVQGHRPAADVEPLGLGHQPVGEYPGRCGIE